MKRIFVFAMLLAAVVTQNQLIAQQDPAAAAAERELAEERHRSLNKRLTDMEESIAAFQRNVSALRDEIRHVKDDLDRTKNKNESAATQETFKKLAEKIEEVDRKRAASDERNIKAIEQLGKDLLSKPVGGGRTVPPSANSNPQGSERPKPPTQANPGGRQPGWEYKIRANDTLAGIVVALKKQGINVSQTQIEKANEGVNWNRLKINQVIFIPQP